MVPLATASILLHKADLLGYCWDDLRRAAAVAYDCNSFTSVVHRVIPSGSVKHWTVERLHARKLHISGEGNRTDSGNENRSSSAELNTSVQVFEMHVPFLFAAVPLGADAFNSRMNMSAEVELVNRVF